MQVLSLRMMNDQESTIALAFPPLVHTNFGLYYPSIAALSAYLKENNIDNLQFDLNETFAEYIINDVFLDKIINEKSINEEIDIEKWLLAKALKLKNKSFFNEEGKHLFVKTSHKYASLLHDFSRHFITNISVEELVSKGLNQVVHYNLYWNFFNSTKLQSLKNLQVIGISVPMGPQLIPSLALGEYIRTINKNIKIIYGGPSFSLMNEIDIEKLLKTFCFIDGIVRYDGEIPFLQICQTVLRNSWEPEKYSNFCFYKNQKVYFNPLGKGDDINDLPFGIYQENILSKLTKPIISVTQARGCYWGRCSYCDFIELYKGEKRYRTVKPERLIEEIEFHLKEKKITNFSLITEALPPAFANKFSDLIIERNINISWFSFAMVHKGFTKELFSKMRSAGCDHLVIGMETLNSRVLSFVNKYSNEESNIEFLENAKSTGINLIINLIPDLPSTTKEEAIRVLEKLEDYIDCIAKISVFPFEATLSSDVGRRPEYFGLNIISSKEKVGQSQYCNNNLHFEDQAMTLDERKQIHELYFAFANKINSKKNESRIEVDNKSHGELNNIDSNYLKIDEEQSSYLLNLTNNKALKITKGLGILIDLIEENLVDESELMSYFNRESLTTLKHSLAENGFLIM